MANTKKLIETKFIKLLETTPLSEITIQRLVSVCGINRNTFYYHYHNIENLIESILTEEADRIIAEHPSLDSVDECLYTLLEFVQTNRAAISNVYNSVSRITCEKYLWIVSRHLVTAYANTAFKDLKISSEYQETLTHYYESLCFGLAMNWLKNGADTVIARHEIEKYHQIIAKLTKNKTWLPGLDSNQQPRS